MYMYFQILVNIDLTFGWQIRTEEMDLIAERGIAAHYSGKVFVNGLVGHAMPSGRTSRGKTVGLNNANIALRVYYFTCTFIHVNPYMNSLVINLK